MILVKGQVKQLPRYGENIYRRKDGRWEGRYIAMRLPDGRAKYKSVYGKTHDIVKKKVDGGNSGAGKGAGRSL